MTKCHFCDKPGPYGYRKPGPLSEQPRKGYMWACADHRDDAEAARKKAIEEFKR